MKKIFIVASLVIFSIAMQPCSSALTAQLKVKPGLTTAPTLKTTPTGRTHCNGTCMCSGDKSCTKGWKEKNCADPAVCSEDPSEPDSIVCTCKHKTDQPQ
jgi:hypothetical protein